MSTATIEIPVQASGSIPDEGAATLGEHIVSPIQKLTEKKNYWGFLVGKDAAVYLSLLSVPAPEEKAIDVPSLQSKLSSLLPGDPQLERRARKLAWHLLKARRMTCEWDYVSLSELTPAESRISDEEFLARYPDQVKASSNKGGRPRKYRTAAARRKGHAERQQRYRTRKHIAVSGVTKTPLQRAER